MRPYAALLLLAACASTATPGDEPLLVSRIGMPLYPLAFDAEREAELEADLAAARADLDADPYGEDAHVWVGRRLAYLGRYHEAIEVYTAGLGHHPDSAKLLRHRGHRYLTLREFDRAILDLKRARALLLGVPDEVEPDGQPNAHGIPRSTLKSNVGYHLGLAQFLQGDYAAALGTYWETLEHSRVNDDMYVATAYWLHQTLRREGFRRSADELLDTVRADMEILENHAYHRLLLLYRGDLALEDLAPDGADGVQDATVGYGIASHHLQRGDGRAASDALWRVVGGEAWPAFGHIAAEMDLRRFGAFLSPPADAATEEGRAAPDRPGGR